MPLPPPQASSLAHCASSKNMSDRHPSPTMMTTRLADAPGGGSTGSRPILHRRVVELKNCGVVVWVSCRVARRVRAKMRPREERGCDPTSGDALIPSFQREMHRIAPWIPERQSVCVNVQSAFSKQRSGERKTISHHSRWGSESKCRKSKQMRTGGISLPSQRFPLSPQGNPALPLLPWGWPS